MGRIKAGPALSWKEIEKSRDQLRKAGVQVSISNRLVQREVVDELATPKTLAESEGATERSMAMG
ncbi:MAG: hypothetical protein Q9209_001241 [Squamulea sp. 1 TL-2023]